MKRFYLTSIILASIFIFSCESKASSAAEVELTRSKTGLVTTKMGIHFFVETKGKDYVKGIKGEFDCVYIKGKDQEEKDKLV